MWLSRIARACVFLSFVACADKTAPLWPSPGHFPAPVPQSQLQFEPNHSSIALGKALFFDPILSADSTVSCASCHRPEAAFSDSPKTLSSGIHGRLGDRNALALFNLAFYNTFMWDGGVHTIESQALVPITDLREMGSDLALLVPKLKAQNGYVEMFQKAFGTDTITSQRIMVALAHFQRTLVSSRSRYDHYVLGKAKLSAGELKGLRLVQTHCGGCHKGVLFTDGKFHNNGLDSTFPEFNKTPLLATLGRTRVTENLADLGKYRTPTLRNLGFTAPYMHDGRLATLDDVLAHYTTGIKYSHTLDQRLRHGITLSADEQESIKLFLSTLNDSSFVQASLP